MTSIRVSGASDESGVIEDCTFAIGKRQSRTSWLLQCWRACAGEDSEEMERWERTGCYESMVISWSSRHNYNKSFDIMFNGTEWFICVLVLEVSMF